ncbi:hypothetical protein WR25_10509 [Diploscapter pachys]|uniref:Uncharacterized protein n=1 Tax=Diploscapter pachys TaxID=2018661 RepID=A0A2A2JYL0_9BILA|nr:hypothetical protein WR25_10509 [Diploscapter pachys]
MSYRKPETGFGVQTPNIVMPLYPSYPFVAPGSYSGFWPLIGGNSIDYDPYSVPVTPCVPNETWPVISTSLWPVFEGTTQPSTNTTGP